MKVKNISDEVQTFTDHAPFEAAEVRDVSEEDGAVLTRSPFIVEVTDEEKPKSKKSFKGVEDPEKTA